MGQNQSKNVCCWAVFRDSNSEANLYTSNKNSFCRGSSYESPIPDEVFETNPHVGYKDEYSTDVEKLADISQEPLKSKPKTSSISFGSRKSLDKLKFK